MSASSFIVGSPGLFFWGCVSLVAFLWRVIRGRWSWKQW